MAEMKRTKPVQREHFHCFVRSERLFYYTIRTNSTYNYYYLAAGPVSNPVFLSLVGEFCKALEK